MGMTREESAAKRTAAVTQMETQLDAWSTQLDSLVAGYLEAGAYAHDPYRLRIDALRERCGVAQTKLDEFKDANPSGQRGTWGVFQSDIKEDWGVLGVLEVGFQDLTR